MVPPTKGHFENTYHALNIALMLRKPILVSGTPGIGKSSLAYYLAYRLGLGEPLVWPINSKTTLQSGLYHYDAIGHLGASQTGDVSIDEYVFLGPLGTALYSWKTPRVLLIDEMDKASFDLPNDLLYILEDGQFTIPELRRSKKDAMVFGSDIYKKEEGDSEESKRDLHILDGNVQMFHPPIMIITSNNERTFSPAFMRRCVDLRLDEPNTEQLKEIVKRHFQKGVDEELLESIHKSKKTPYEILQEIMIQKKLGNNIDLSIISR